MVSLAAAERIAETAVPEIRHAVVALPDPRRGEKLVLVTEARGFDRNRLARSGASAGNARDRRAARGDRNRSHAASRHRQNRLFRRHAARRAGDGGSAARNLAGGTGRFIACSRLTNGRAGCIWLWVIIIGFLAGAIAKLFIGGPARVHRDDLARHCRRDLRDLARSADRLVRAGPARRFYRRHRRSGADSGDLSCDCRPADRLRLLRCAQSAVYSQLRNAVIFRANDYMNRSGCAAEAQSLFCP